MKCLQINIFINTYKFTLNSYLFIQINAVAKHFLNALDHILTSPVDRKN